MSSPVSFVRRVTPVPSAFMTYSWLCPSRSLANATCAPSGENAGYVSLPGPVVSWVRPLPSAAIASTLK